MPTEPHGSTEGREISVVDALMAEEICCFIALAVFSNFTLAYDKRVSFNW